WRGRFTLLPAFTLQDRVLKVCQQSGGWLSSPFYCAFFARNVIHSRFCNNLSTPYLQHFDHEAL
ncbi:hypothetical protein, partial [Yersinia enterocolitica]|uniref:hypothetical protein n=4 Tax=Yersinia enterocolitica TaxID=630 RepID=UPI001C10DA20